MLYLLAAIVVILLIVFLKLIGFSFIKLVSHHALISAEHEHLISKAKLSDQNIPSSLPLLLRVTLSSGICIGSRNYGVAILRPHPTLEKISKEWDEGKSFHMFSGEKRYDVSSQYSGPFSTSSVANTFSHESWYLSFVGMFPVFWKFWQTQYGDEMEMYFPFRTTRWVANWMSKCRPDDTLHIKADEESTRKVSYMVVTYSKGKIRRDYRDSPVKRIEDVVLEKHAYEELTSILQGFGRSRDQYMALGVCYKVGILLQGSPGTGKTSLIKAVAAHYDVALTFVDLPTFSKDSFSELTGYLKDRSGIIVLEDIDATGISVSRANTDESTIQLSQLLNFLDGLNTPSDSVIILTTNHPEALDPAIIRPGRVDYTVSMYGLTPDEAIRILHSTLEAAKKDPHMLDDKFYETFGHLAKVQPALVQQFAQQQIFGFIAPTPTPIPAEQ